MTEVKFDFDIHIIDGKEYVPFNQLITFIRKLNPYVPKLDLETMARNFQDRENWKNKT